MDVADAGATVTVLDGTATVGSAMVQPNGTWTATGVTLSSGSNSLTARVTIGRQYRHVNAVIYTLSTTGPSVTEALSIDTGSSASDHITSNDAVSGTGLANTGGELHHRRHRHRHPGDGQRQWCLVIHPDRSGRWPAHHRGEPDPHLGNTGSASLNFTLDTTAPVVAITSAGGATNQASQTISGTVDVADAGATVTILDGTTAVGSAVVQANGTGPPPASHCTVAATR